MAEKNFADAHSQDHGHTHGQGHDHGHEHHHSHEHGHNHGHAGAIDDETARQDAMKANPVTVTVEEAGPARKLLTIEVPQERISSKVERGFEKLKSDAAIPGFRRGRVPMRLLQKRFGDSLKQDVRTELLAECYDEAVEGQKIEVLGEPEIKDLAELKLPETGSLTFKVEVEIAPKFELPSLEGVAVNKEKYAVDESLVGKEIEILQKRLGQLVQSPGSSVEPGDFVLGRVGIRQGADAPETAPEILPERQSYVVSPEAAAIGVGNIAGIAIDDLGSRLSGKKAGDEVVISLTGPKGHENDQIKDKPITIRLKIDRIDRLELAPLEKVASEMGVADAEAMKGRMKEHLEMRAQRGQHNAMLDQIRKHLTDSVNFDLPPGMSARQTARVLRRTAMDMAYQGVPEIEIEQKLAELRGQSEAAARAQLKQFFVLEQAARKLEIEVKENEVNGTISAMAMEQNRRPEKLRQELIRSGQVEQVFLYVREQKTLEAILAKAAVTETGPAKK